MKCLHYYSSTNERCNPTTIGNIDLNANQIDENISQKADWLWAIARNQMTETDNSNQNVPGWTGFYHKVMGEHLPDTISEVYYLPSINQSPTKMDTVQEVLLQVKAKAKGDDGSKKRRFVQILKFAYGHFSCIMHIYCRH